jgi:hypothetical protein
MSHLMLVPFAVRQRGRGLVRDPAVHGYSLLDPQWVPAGTTVSDRKKAHMLKKVDRVIAVLSRFAAYCARTRRFRKVFPVCDDAWANIAEREDIRIAAERAARIRALILMPEAELNAHFRNLISVNHEIGSLWNFMIFIRAKRAEREAQIEESNRVWREMNFSRVGLSVRPDDALQQAFRVGSALVQPVQVVSTWMPMSFQNIGVPVRLNNPQAVAPVRRVVFGRFSALDSDDE